MDLGRGWFIGKPKPEKMGLEAMIKEIPLTKEGWDILLKNRASSIRLLLNDEVLDYLVTIDKFTQDEIEKLREIRNSLSDKNAFYQIFRLIYDREGGWNYERTGTVSIYWFYERMLLEEGLDRHRKFIQKMLK